MHFMLQKEVVDRLSAAPGNGQYGRLSVMVQYRCEVAPLFNIGPGAFRPQPKVDSAFVRLTPLAQPAVSVPDEAMLGRVVQLAFGQRRKTLRNSLRGMVDEETLQFVGIDPGLRPEAIPIADYVSLANALE